MGTIFEVIHINTDGKELKAQLEEVVEKLYIIIDYHKKGERGNDAWRDKVKFETPPFKMGKEVYSKEIRQHIANDPTEKQRIKKIIDNDFKQRSDKNKSGVDTLTPIGWKGIKANDLDDALNKATSFLAGRKAKLIVIRTHGYTDKKTIFMSVDNNWKFLSPEAKEKSEKKSDNLSTDGINSVLNKEEKVIYLDAAKNLNTLVNLSQLVEDNGDFVIGSCHSAYNDSFISPLQVTAGSRVNMYGIYFLSSFPAEREVSVNYNIYIKTEKGTKKIQIDGEEKSVDTDTAYITKEEVFSNTSMLSPVNMDKKPQTNYACKFPVGWKEGDKSIKLSSFSLNSKGLVY